jgi:hypothetical protein
VRPLFNEADHYLGVDIAPGPNVDVVADAATWHPGAPLPRQQCRPQFFDTVVCCETLEHTPAAEHICGNAHQLLLVGGVFLVTTAGLGRAPHSAVDGGPLRQVLCERTGVHIDEFYRNVSRLLLSHWLAPFGFAMIDTTVPGDIYALAVKVQ